jgi:GT2 family glycosyltransferase
MENNPINSLDIIVVNWNTGGLLSSCLSSISCLDGKVNYRVIIIDNNSSDGSADFIQDSERLLVVKKKSNEGFSRSCNTGILNSAAKYILFLNPDTLINAEAVLIAISLLNNNPKYGIIGVKHLDASGMHVPSCSRFLSVKFLLNDLTGFSRFFPGKFKPATLMVDWDHSFSSEVDQVMGSFMLMRSKDIKELNGFDETFFLYFEDMDLALRAKRTGLISFYEESVNIIHAGGGSSTSVKDLRLFYYLRSRLLYSKKNFPPINFYSVCFLTFVPEFFSRLFISVFKSERKGEFISVLSGYTKLVKWIVLKK